MHALPRRRGADGLRGEAIGRPNRRGPRPVLEPVGTLVYSPPSRLRRRSAASRDRRLSRSSHAAYFALMRASSVLLGSLTSEWRDSNPRPRGPQPRAANCATFRNRRHPPPEPKPRWAKKEDGGVARRPGLEPGSTVLETAVLAIAPPTQREASMTPRAWPPGHPDGRRRGRLPRAPSRIRTGDLPLTRRLRYHWAIGA